MRLAGASISRKGRDMRIARAATAALAALALVGLAACTGGASTPTVVVTAPTVTPTPSATPVVTPVVTPTPTGHFYTLDETWNLAPETKAQGSGCTPGGGLPDGIWFGHVTTWSPTSISFDMECWWTGSGAQAQATAHGDEVNNDYYLTNDVPTVRTVTVAPGAFGLKADVLNISDTTSWVMYTPAQVIADPGGTMPTINPPLVWLAVNGGMVTSFAVQYVP